jgi:hypothetical protein
MAFSQTNVKGVITSDQVWDISGSPYIITQNTYIDTFAKVVVMPGVVIKDNGDKNELIVDGGFRAVGTKDSLVSIEKVEIVYNKSSQGYDPISGKGALIKWCKIEGPDLSLRSFSLSSKSILFEHCLFEIAYYGIYKFGSTADSSTLWINECDFVHTDPGSGESVYVSGGEVNIKNSSFKYGRSVYLAGALMVENSRFEEMEKVRFGIMDDVLIQCNEFSNIEEGIYFQHSGNVRSGINVTVINNTLDSFGDPILSDYFSMMEIRDVNPSKGTNYRFNNNNFLHYTGTSEKIKIYGTNPAPTSFTSLNFKNNYWETTVSSDIDTMIADYNDDVTIFGKVDYSGALSAKDTTCNSANPPVCKASYYVGVDTSHIFNLFIITNSTGTTSNTTYSWDFGDGKTSNKKNPTHQYSTFGKYNLCLTIKDSTTGCNSTYCDSIGLDSLGNVLKANGFTITVVDEGEVLSTKNIEKEKVMKVFPNPTSGMTTIQFESSGSEEFNMNILDVSGRLIHHENSISKIGSNRIKVDLSLFPEGLYFIKIQTRTSVKTVKILKKL